MTTNGVTMQRLARWTSYQLSEDENKKLAKALEALHGVPPERWARRKNVERLKGEPPLFLLHFTPEWRAFITPAEGGGIEVENIMHKERIAFFRKHAAGTGDGE